jgi:hypothetical protein
MQMVDRVIQHSNYLDGLINAYHLTGREPPGVRGANGGGTTTHGSGRGPAT